MVQSLSDEENYLFYASQFYFSPNKYLIPLFKSDYSIINHTFSHVNYRKLNLIFFVIEI